MGNSFTTTSKDALDAGGGAESISPIDTSSTDDRQERSPALAHPGTRCTGVREGRLRVASSLAQRVSGRCPTHLR